ncbi:MAG: TonB C-terminal domain-containing protein [Verrucomicrobiota bacterium]|jgi:outer membrane biosynthesis protein TonB
MLPQTQVRKKRNSSKVNLLISFVFHALIVATLLYFAARQGLLGKQMKKISIDLVKAKPPEKPKTPEKPKVEPPKVEQPKAAAAPRIEPPKEVAAAPTAAPPTVAPPAAELPSFEFDGGKEVISSTDPVQLYKSSVEYALRSKWVRPDDVDDANFVAEVGITVGRKGELSNPVWEKSSGNEVWDQSVRRALAEVTSMDRPPPTNFPSHIVVRFDVQPESEQLLQ